MKKSVVFLICVGCIAANEGNKHSDVKKKHRCFEVEETDRGVGFKHVDSLFGGSATQGEDGDLMAGVMAGLEKSVTIERFADTKREILTLSLTDGKSDRVMYDLDIDGQWDFWMEIPHPRGKVKVKYVLLDGQRLDVRRLSMETPEVYCEDMNARTLIFSGGRWAPGEPSKR